MMFRILWWQCLRRSCTQVKRFRMETKAAKTLGIIVGGFILCWLPFFTMYLVRAFCPNHIHPTVFSVLFWLGYCNSAINPCIYALFSKDFRFAFKRILCCRCSCIQRANTLRRGSDGSQLAMRSVLQFVLQSGRVLRFIFARPRRFFRAVWKGAFKSPLRFVLQNARGGVAHSAIYFNATSRS